ncbi:mannose-6-phosphate isomerase, class I [soil metagenome]
MSELLGPMLLTPILHEKVWGGDRLRKFGKAVAPGARVGESWEVADMAGTSATGAGGGAARSVIENGPLKGKTLHDAVVERAGEVLGRSTRAGDSGGGVAPAAFPLLVKFLDAREDLSVQVHPSPEYAAAHAGAHLKTECWYILDAAPGSRIYKGVKSGVTRSAFERALGAGGGAGVVELLARVPAVVGECHNLPSGTVHALGGGVLVAEVQTPSDTTFRVHDWGRSGRALHVQEALECIEFAAAPPATRGVRSSQEDWSRLVTTEFFTLDECVLGEDGVGVGERGCVLMVVEGAGGIGGAALVRGADPGDRIELATGRSVVVPAAAARAWRITGAGARVLRAWWGGWVE